MRKLRLKFWRRAARKDAAPQPTSLAELAAAWRAILPLSNEHIAPEDLQKDIPQILLNDLYPLMPQDVCKRLSIALGDPYVFKPREVMGITEQLRTSQDLYDIYQAIQYLPQDAGAEASQVTYRQVFAEIKPAGLGGHLYVARAMTAVAFLTANTTASGRANLLTFIQAQGGTQGAPGLHELETRLVENLVTYTPLMHKIAALVHEYEIRQPHVRLIVKPVKFRWYDRLLP